MSGMDVVRLPAAHLGDPLALVIADAIGTASLDTVVGAFMPCGERWELATIIAAHVRQSFASTIEGEGE